MIKSIRGTFNLDWLYNWPSFLPAMLHYCIPNVKLMAIEMHVFYVLKMYLYMYNDVSVFNLVGR